jgi:myo-inositol 2-dehydrogenase/D-chiro-inositol 1-dehydrogenase
VNTSAKDAPLLRLGLIGPGGVAGNYLIPALKRVEGAAFWSVLGRDKERAQAFAATHGAVAPVSAYSDMSQFLSDPHLDAVIIATPDRFHAQQAVAAAKAGKHVFLEKPMATSKEEAREIVSAVSASKVALAVGYHLRFHAGHKLLRQAIANGAIGALKHMHVCWTMTASANDWRNSPETGRWFSLAATGTHGLDLAMWFNQAAGNGDVKDLRAIASRANPDSHDETALVNLKFDSGATAEVVSSVAFKAPRTIALYGTAGSAICTDTLGPRGAGSILLNGESLPFEVVDPYFAELTDFLETVRGQKESASSGENGLANVDLMERISANWGA